MRTCISATSSLYFCPLSPASKAASPVPQVSYYPKHNALLSSLPQYRLSCLPNAQHEDTFAIVLYTDVSGTCRAQLT